MSPSPRVSIVLPVFNAEPYLAQCIDSMLCQTFSDFELLIINDGSTDDSQKVIHHYAQLDSRIVVINHPNNIGLISVLNSAIALCKGEYIARMDADDWSVSSRIQIQVNFLDTHPRVGIVGSWIKLFGEKNEIWHYRQHDHFIKALLLFKTNGFPHNSLIIRKSLVQSFLYNTKFEHIEDTELWTRIMMESSHVQFYNIPKVLTYYRTYNGQVSYIHKQKQDLGYEIIIMNMLKHIVGNVTALDYRCHYELIKPTTPLNEKSIHRIGDWVERLHFLYSCEYQDSFFVITQKWAEYCLNFHDKKKAYKLYTLYKPKSIDFCFLIEKECLK